MSEAGGPDRGADDERAAAISIVLADDHDLVRAGLRMLLEAEGDMTVVAEAGDIAETERVVAARGPDVLVLDVQLPDGSGISAIPRLRAVSPATRVVMLTMRDDPDSAREALQSGATGYVLKRSAREELIAAVRLVAAGRTYLHPELGARMATDARPAQPPDDLSPRELEVLRLLALGHTNAEIAAQLYLSVRTVESHRARIQQKTQRSSRAELVAYARERELV